METQIKVNHLRWCFWARSPFRRVLDTSANKNKAIVCTSYVEESSYVNNHLLLSPAQVCCQGKPRGLFARQKNSLPQERRIPVSLLSIFNRMHACTDFLVFLWFAAWFLLAVSAHLFFWIYTKYESEQDQRINRFHIFVIHGWVLSLELYVSVAFHAYS